MEEREGEKEGAVRLGSLFCAAIWWTLSRVVFLAKMALAVVALGAFGVLIEDLLFRWIVTMKEPGLSPPDGAIFKSSGKFFGCW